MKKILSLSLSVAAAAVLAENAGWDWDFGSGITLNEKPIAKFEAFATWQSCDLDHGVELNKDPIFVLEQTMDLFGWITFGLEESLNTTHIGREYSLSDRSYMWHRTEIDFTTTLHHEFDVGTKLFTALAYSFEYQPIDYGNYDEDFGDYSHETHVLMAWIGLPDLCLGPELYYERDLDEFDNTYVKFSLNHTFNLVAASEDGADAPLTLTLSLGQAWGDRKSLWHSIYGENEGLADTSLTATLDWNLAKGVSLTGWFTASDYLFNPHMKSTLREFSDHSWALQAGLTFGLSF